MRYFLVIKIKFMAKATKERKSDLFHLSFISHSLMAGTTEYEKRVKFYFFSEEICLLGD